MGTINNITDKDLINSQFAPELPSNNFVDPESKNNSFVQESKNTSSKTKSMKSSTSKSMTSSKAKSMTSSKTKSMKSSKDKSITSSITLNLDDYDSIFTFTSTVYDAVRNKKDELFDKIEYEHLQMLTSDAMMWSNNIYCCAVMYKNNYVINKLTNLRLVPPPNYVGHLFASIAINDYDGVVRFLSYENRIESQPIF